LNRSVALGLNVSSTDPGYRPVYIRLELSVYNVPVILSSGLVLASSIMFILSARGRTMLVVESVKSLEKGVREERKEDIQRLFHSLVDLLERLSRTRFKPSYTIREYLSLLRYRLPKRLWGSVRFFLLRLEDAIYSRLEGEKSLIETIIRRLMRALGGGS